MRVKIKKDDTVLIISGKDKGKKGKVIEALPKRESVVVEGVNLRKKSVRPKKSGEKGQIITLPTLIPASNVKLICTKCGKATKLSYKIIEGKKVRVCKKCRETI